MGKTVYEAIKLIREAETQRDLGTRFEVATKYFLRNDPYWSKQLENVLLWSESPYHDGQDRGIDLTADDRFGEKWAIQSKCYDSSHKLDFKECSTFFSSASALGFDNLMLVTTCDSLSSNLEEHIRLEKQNNNRNIVVINPSDIEASTLEWDRFINGDAEHASLAPKFEPRPHQRAAIDDIIAEFGRADRCKAIMACGTGKTLMSQRLSEEYLAGKESPLILFAAPSIALVGQSMRSWVNQTKVGLRTLVVCSDAKASRLADDELSDTLADLAFPASTDPSQLYSHWRTLSAEPGPIAVFSTYQSMQVISDAQAKGLPEFDLVVCDEAHRTTGYEDPGTSKQDASAFTKVHDNAIVKGAKRLYMTATERIYGTEAKDKRDQQGFVLTSMDDESIYGRTAHEITFAEAVENNLLCDYRVVVLAIGEDAMPAGLQMMLSDGSELPMSDVAKIVGTWKGLANHGAGVEEASPYATDEDDNFFLIEDLDTFGEGVAEPLHRAVGFTSTIKDSKQIVEAFKQVTDHYRGQGIDYNLECELDHVDGGMDSKTRNSKLEWLAADTSGGEHETCRILTNARCLAEGVDVPSLDAVIFFAPKKSKIDVVQAVGRVMRTFKGKKYGYIILPVFIPSGMAPEDALDNSRTFDVVWDVLQALRSHDKRVDAYVDSLPFRKKNKRGDVIGKGGRGKVVGDADPKPTDGEEEQMALDLDYSREGLEDAIFTKMVKKVGTRVYWDTWADDVAVIAERHIARLTQIVADDPAAAESFAAFLQGLRDSLNESITQADAIEMVAQHMITLPVFDALFGNYEFRSQNPVSKAIEHLLDAIGGYEFADDDEKRVLDDLYASVSRRARAMRSDEARQQLIKDLYNEFFAKAFKRTSSRMGIVYTPNEVVDYVLKATDRLLYKEFGQHMSDENVHILDPFTGTGTFIVNLLSDPSLMPVERLADKYANELHFNEIVLLAYYIASINVEYAYHNRMGGLYEAFPGGVLADTFQMHEDGDPIDRAVFTGNTARALKQMETPITVVVGNPPWSAGQKDANENAANESYPTLDARIEQTYAAKSGANLKNSLYDSYIRAFRWASDRIGRNGSDRGIVSFVTNGGWLRSAAAAGMRRCLVEEFNSIYVFDLRGNQRTQGEQSRKEGGKIFGSGSRAPVTITMLVKNPDSDERGVIHYHDIGDYLTQAEKLQIVKEAGEQGDPEWEILTMDRHGDWLDQRDDSWYNFAPMGLEKMKEPQGIFNIWSCGNKTQRDSWAVGFGVDSVANNMQSHIDFYNHELERWILANRSMNSKSFVDYDPKKISWTAGLLNDFKCGKKATFDDGYIRSVCYRPFSKQYVYWNKMFNERQGQLPKLFPTPDAKNLVIDVSERGPFISDMLPDLELIHHGQCFPLYWYETEETGGLLNGGGKAKRRDAITDRALEVFRAVYPHVYAGGHARTVEQAKADGLSDKQAREERGEVAKVDIFYYVYGILHSPEYRERFAANLAKELPRIPFAADFKRFAQAGRDLVRLHLGYEDGPMYPLEEKGGAAGAADPGRLVKLAWGKGKDHTKIVYNANLTLAGIPEDAERYTVNGKTALGWLIDRYKVTTDKKSGIVNDPNDYSDDPRYVVDLIKRVTYVAVETMKIVDSLPPLREIDPPEGTMPFEWTAGA